MSDRLDYDKRKREVLEHHRCCVQDQHQRLAYGLAILARDKQEELQRLHLARAKVIGPKLIRTQWGVLFG